VNQTALRMRSRLRRWAGMGMGGVAATVAICAMGAQAASADTLVYVKGGYVYVSNADGSGARAVTPQSQWWAWPSESDGGQIAVAGGASRTDGGFIPTGSDQIFEFDQQGHQLSGPVNTEGSYSLVWDPIYVSHFRVAPDNSYVAWTTNDPAHGLPYSAWQAPGGSNAFQTANDSDGAPLEYDNPEWWGTGHLLLAHDGTTIGTQPEYMVYGLADGSTPGWYNDEAIGSSPSWQVAVTRNGLTYAVLIDDAADYGGTVHNASITLETTATPPTNPTAVSSTHCTITLPAADYATTNGTGLASMSFSADGHTLAWGQDDGVYEANVSDPSNCAQVTGSVHRVVAGGAMPFLSPAPLSPSQPGPSPVPPTPVCHTNCPQVPVTHRPVAAFVFAPAHPRAGHKLRFSATASHETGGRIVRYRWSFGDRHRGGGRKVQHAFRRAGRYTVSLTVIDGRGTSATIRRRIVVGR
jgi:hypothetical protein